MKNIILVCFLFVSVLVRAQKNEKTLPITGRTISFDDDWLFAKDSGFDAQRPNLDDTKWRKLDLPHDWSNEDLPNQIEDSIVGPFDKGSIPGYKAGYVLASNPFRLVSRFLLPNGYQTAYAVGKTAWYRKKFTIDKGMAKKHITINFDGVYMNSDVWLNGHFLGNHPNGYTPFNYDLTPYLKPAGQQNVLVVRVRNEGKNSRWYTGSGIYRYVSLTATEPMHIDPWGIYIVTPKVSAKNATVQIKTSISNEQLYRSNINVVTTFFAPNGKVVGMVKTNSLLDGGSKNTATQNTSIANPSLWSVETPYLYKAITELREGNKVLDKVETVFGIRSISFSAQNGFLLNGKRVILKGGCIHHDNGPLGAAAIDRAEERKIQLLKQNGYNAIRTSHNPPSKHLLEVCDQLGMLVLEEAFDVWEKEKDPEDYHLYFKEWWQRDMQAILLRDRNHPSIIMWSIGNEIPERADSSGLRITKQLVEKVRQFDISRPVTEAHCKFWDHPEYMWDTTAHAFALLDVGGYNYLRSLYESDHKKYPQRIMLGTETYPKEALENFTLSEEHPYVLGDFVWTAFDYMGESGLGNNTYDTIKGSSHNSGWPWFNAYCGDIDLVGNKKTASYYRDVVWRNRKISMAVHAPIPEGKIENVSNYGWPDEMLSWTWPQAEGKPLQVRVFTRAPIVRLYLNGKVIGEQKVADSSITAVFKVSYQPGTLSAVNIVDGKETDAFELKTAGAPKHIRLVADRTNINADRNDLSYVMVEVTDDNGQLVPNIETLVHFLITGAGEIAGVGNSSPTDMASFRRPERKTINGKCLVIVRPKGNAGKIILKAEAAGLKETSIEINTK